MLDQSLLPKELKIKYTDEMKKIEGGKKMSYLTSFEEVGIEIGLERGLHKGETLILRSILETKFKNIPGQYFDLISQAKEHELITWSKRVVFAKTIEDVFIN